MCHGIELPFVFHSVKPFYNFTPAEDDLSKYEYRPSWVFLTQTCGPHAHSMFRRMAAYWTNFAKSGNPNHPRAVTPTWPAYHPLADASMEFVTPPKVQTGLRASYCDFWDRLGYSHGM